MKIPLVDLHAQYNAIKTEVDAALERVVVSGSFIGGPEVVSFEREFASFCRARYCVGVGNGTDAIFLALKALGIGMGDEVITVAHTFIATAEAITASGARPVFVDVMDDTLLMLPEALENAISPRTKAIIPVHLYGQACEMDMIMEIAATHGLKVIEDAAQAHGAAWHGKRVGTFGDAGCFSFFPGKNLGAYGDSGAVVGNDETLMEKVRMLANHGRLEKYTHRLPGFNSRLDSLQAAVLRTKLPHLDGWNNRRREIAVLYRELLKDSPVRLPAESAENTHVWHLFVVRLKERDRIKAQLAEAGIETGIHYPVPVHLQPAYDDLAINKGSLPVTEKAVSEILSLPIYGEMSSANVEMVCKAIKAAL